VASPPLLFGTNSCPRDEFITTGGGLRTTESCRLAFVAFPNNEILVFRFPYSLPIVKVTHLVLQDFFDNHLFTSQPATPRKSIGRIDQGARFRGRAFSLTVFSSTRLTPIRNKSHCESLPRTNTMAFFPVVRHLVLQDSLDNPNLHLFARIPGGKNILSGLDADGHVRT